MKNIALLTLIAVLIFGCKSAPVYNDPIPKHDELTIQSEYVKEKRVINVWTPPNYSQVTDSFPVLYMPDGGIKEDFPHIANTLNKLIEQNKIPPYILVGIENTVRSRDLTGPSEVEYDLKHVPISGGSGNFRAFIKEELFPEIDKRYRTTGTRAIIGESSSGLFIVESFLLAPDMFNYYIAMDPALWWNDQYLVKNAAELLPNDYGTKKKLWFAGSDATDISTHARQLEEALKTKSPAQLTWKYTDEPDEKHHTIFRATKEKALIWTLNNKE